MDDKLSPIFYEFLTREYGVEDEDFVVRTLGETGFYLYLEVWSNKGTDQIVYAKDTGKWDIIT